MRVDDAEIFQNETKPNPQLESQLFFSYSLNFNLFNLFKIV